MPGPLDPGFDTLALHAGAAPDAATGARALPIHLSTSFVFESSEQAAKSEIGTFLEAFPNGMVFGNTQNGRGYDLVLVGPKEPTRYDVDRIEERLRSPEYAQVARSLASDLEANQKEIQLDKAKTLEQEIGAYVQSHFDRLETMATAVTHLAAPTDAGAPDRKSTRLNSSH